MGLEDPCHLRGPVQLVETQFPRFAGILGIRRRRHGDGARTPSKQGSPREVCGVGGEGTLSGPPLCRPRPRSPVRAPRGPSPGSGRRAAPPRASPRRPPGCAALVRSVRSCHSRRGSRYRRRRRCRHGPGAEARRHFRPPCIPPPRRRRHRPRGARGGCRGTGFPLPRGARTEPSWGWGCCACTWGTRGRSSPPRRGR